MEIYQENAPTTPHVNKMKAGLKVTFGENVKTPFPQKAFGNNNTPFPSKAGSAKPRRALADISNANQVSVAPRTASKPTAKKPSTAKTVRFEEDVDTCTRISKFRATPYKPEVERIVKIYTNQWLHDPSFPAEELEIETDIDKEFCVTESSASDFVVDPTAFEQDEALMI